MDTFAIRNLFGIDNFNIAWYGVFITTGMILGIMLAAYRTKKRGINPDIIFDFAFLTLPLAIIGARAYYVIFKWESYSDNIIKIFAVN
jgi:phosphatidylglycerol:prolipoprotein diacylglycerol transferase